MEAISSAWTPQAFAQVALQVVTLHDVRDAFLQNPSLPKVSLRRVPALGQSVATILRRLPDCRGHLAISAWVGVSLTVEVSISSGLVSRSFLSEIAWFRRTFSRCSVEAAAEGAADGLWRVVP